jgi:fumarate reductase flavoprotein subunit
MSAKRAARSKNLEADVVVIGGGGAGLAAAAAAAEEGARVIVLEKRGLGGTSAMAFGIFGAESPTQKRLKIDCPRDACFRVAMDWTHWRINPRIVRAFIDKSGDTIRWLEEKGVAFDCNQAGPGLSTFHLAEGRGAGITKALAQSCRDRGVPLLIRTQAKKILTGRKGNITGVLAAATGEEFTIKTRSVIIATGGYGGNKELLRKYCPQYHDGMERIGLAHTGDGLLMATAVGAATEGLGALLLGMPSALHPPDLHVRADYPISIFTIGLISIASDPRAIMVNKMGQRFTDEAAGLGTSNRMVQQPDNVCYTLWDSRMTGILIAQGPFREASSFAEEVPKSQLPGLEKDLRRIEAEKGLVRIFDTWDEMAGYIGCDRKALKATIDEYNSFCDNGHDPIFAKDPKLLLPLRIPPYYAIKWGASYLNTMGGIKINESTEVISQQGNPIPGLYAAGVDTGGWESETYCMRLPGHAFGFSINSGRIAGENAARFALGK